MALIQHPVHKSIDFYRDEQFYCEINYEKRDESMFHSLRA